MEIRRTNTPPTSAIAIGSVLDTLAGRIDPRLKERRFKASDYSFGFEAGSPKDINSIGESLLANDTFYTTSTEEESSEYRKVIFGSEFVTGGIFLLPKGVEPTHCLTLNSSMKLEDLCQETYKEVKRPLSFVGMWECESLHTMVVEKPPIHGKPIFENKDYYFSKPHQIFRNVTCFVMGVMTSYSDMKWQKLNRELEKVLYKNPDDKQESLTIHIHGLILKGKGEEFTPEKVSHCVHIFVDQTSLKKASLDLYALEKVISIE